ncbi:AAA family ATPase [Rhizobium mayense]|uniref:ATP-binding protein n=1 Tax=Rhizobium mayense TaxID=1312184 RepID=A0ABT7JVF3_9HYPH|nr:ATP-binding protein [Rhizobium mayense]MDL2400321.1 ATP-binding protein [Rhizobium mayense]
MDRISLFFIRRLHHLARREARRNAALHGLLGSWTSEEGVHTLRLYGPAFDTAALTGDLQRDLDWFRSRFGADLIRPPVSAGPGAGFGTNADITAATTAMRSTATFVPVRRRSSRRGHEATPEIGLDRRSYAIRLVGMAAEPPLVSHVVAALVLARAIGKGTKSLRDIVRAITHATPVVTLHAPLAGFEREVSRLLEKSRFVPGGPFGIVDGDYTFNDDYLDAQDGETRRRVVEFRGGSIHRVTGAVLRRRMLGAFARDLPIVAIAEKRSDIPALLQITADVSLETGQLDRSFVRDVVEALYPDAAIGDIDLPADSDARWLSLEDVILAFRPGRDLANALSVLARLARRNRDDFEDEEEGGDGNAAASAPKASDKKKPATSSETSTPASSDSDSGGRWKKDKPSGAEIVQPDPPIEPGPRSSSGDDGAKRAKPPLTVEILSGYGKARDWALDLKADLAGYYAGKLDWSDMSSRLLLYGPPGTGKTTFARALCNSLQIPLVVTSVSTWLQGGHLNDVVDKMVKTFAEAKAIAPSILFIDEFDGIGKRQPAEREHADYWNTVVNKALELLDGAVKSEGVIIVGATNRPDDIDEALKRSGRLETHIEIPKPDKTALVDILAHHLGDDVEALLFKASDMLNTQGPPGNQVPPLSDDPTVSEPQQAAMPDLAEDAVKRKGAGR